MSDPDKQPFRPSETMDMITPLQLDANAELAAITLKVQAGFISGDPPTVPVDQKRTLGRTEEADFPAPLDEKISRVHFEIECHRRSGIIRDLDSRNGTFVNGQRVESDCEIHHGDQISAGKTILTVEFEIS